MRPDFSPRTFLALSLAIAVFIASRPASAQTPIPAGNTSTAIAINPATNTIYVTNEFSNDVTVIDGATHATRTVAVGSRPRDIAINTRTNKVYVNNGSDASLSVIDGSTLSVTTLPIGSTGPVSVNEATNKVFVARSGHTDEVTIVDANANTWYTVAINSWWPIAQVVDARNDKLYVATYETGDVKVVDTSSRSDHPPVKSIGAWSRPAALAMDEGARRVYMLTGDSRGPIGIIDMGTDTASFVTAPGHATGPTKVAVDPATQKVYAGFQGEIVVLDAATRALTYLPVSTPVGIAVNTATNVVYAPAADGTMAIVDGRTNAVTRAAIPAGARAVAVNPSTGRVYVAGPGVTYLEPGASPPPPPPPAPGAPAASLNVQGLWWGAPAGIESGWGINFAQQGDIVFATWFTYDTDGSGMWLVMPDARRVGTNTWSGALYRTTGPVFNSMPFDPARVQRSQVGSATIDFSDASNGRLAATVNGVPISKAITRQVFAAPMPTCTAGGSAGATPNYQDLWWNAPAGSESGWGMNITHQGDILFVTWFTYGPDGKGMWLVGPRLERTGNATYSGALYRTTGPAFNASPWNPAGVGRSEVGGMTLSFSGTGQGTVSYTVAGVTQSKSLVRQAFSTPATICR